MSKPYASDQILSHFLKDGAELLSFILRNMINLLIKLSIFQEECEIATLRPIFKKKKWCDKLPTYFTFATSTSILQYTFNLNNVLIKKARYLYQSSFKTNRSTEFCVIQFPESILTSVDKQMHTGMILVIIQEGFDTLDYIIIPVQMK